MFRSVNSCPRIVREVMQAALHHQNHSMRSSAAGRRRASAGTATNRNSSAAVMRRTVSMPSSAYISVSRVIVIIELVQDGTQRAAGQDGERDRAGEQPQDRRR